MELIYFIAGLLGAAIGAALIGFLGRDWLANRLKAAIDKETLIQRAAFDLKYSACLDALEVVNAAYSQLHWSYAGKAIIINKQPLKIEAVRQAYNQLALTCSDPLIIQLYTRAIGLHSQQPQNQAIQLIVDLRNAMRKELGLNDNINLDHRTAWIASLGDTS